MKALFYKEWIKTRWFFLAAALVSLTLCEYCLLNISRITELKGAVHVWEVMLTRDAIFIQLIRFVPFLIGILASLVQFVPEMQQKRIKLTLHLPYSQNKSIGTMLLFGILLLTIIFFLNFLFLIVYLNQVFALELVSRIILTAFVWYLAGFLSYLLTIWICLEPTWKRRMINLLIAVALLRVFFLSETPEVYNTFLPFMVLYTVIVSILPLWSVQRFKDGTQD